MHVPVFIAYKSLSYKKSNLYNFYIATYNFVLPFSNFSSPKMGCEYHFVLTLDAKKSMIL